MCLEKKPRCRNLKLISLLDERWESQQDDKSDVTGERCSAVKGFELSEFGKNVIHCSTHMMK